MGAFEIRAATPADADAVADYHHRCFKKTYSSQLFAGELEAPDRAGTRRQLHDWFLPGSEFETLVAVVDGAPIGHVTVSGHQLVHLFVEPDHQGMGLGRHLLVQGEAMIAARGHTAFELHARVDNVAAIAFYAKGGVDRDGSLDSHRGARHQLRRAGPHQTPHVAVVSLRESWPSHPRATFARKFPTTRH